MPSNIFRQRFQNFHSQWKWLRHCAHCGASRPPIVWLCPPCLKSLKSRCLKARDIARMEGSLKHCRLLDWTLENDHFIRSIIQSLKGRHNLGLFSELAQIFSQKLKEAGLISPPLILTPCPGRGGAFSPVLSSLFSFLKISKPPLIPKKNCVDHGFFLAESLSKQIKAPLHNILSYPIDSENSGREIKQKQQSLSARNIRRFICIKKPPKNNLIVFVDDILTSGATARAAYQALGKPPLFMIWSLFWRKKKNLF